MLGLGTIVNVLAVISGGFIGMFLNDGLKPRFQDILMKALGLSTLFIGVSGALKGMFTVQGSGLETTGTMTMIISLVLGALIGEWIDIEKRMEQFGVWIKSKVRGKDNPRLVEGFVTTSLVICVGAMAVVGSLQDGLTGDTSMLFAKSALDFVVVLIFASAFGQGAMLAAIPLGLYQGAITLFARLIEPILTEQVVADLSFVGSILIFGVGINLAFGNKIKVGNMLPALVIVVIYSLIFNS